MWGMNTNYTPAQPQRSNAAILVILAPLLPVLAALLPLLAANASRPHMKGEHSAPATARRKDPLTTAHPLLEVITAYTPAQLQYFLP